MKHPKTIRIHSQKLPFFLLFFYLLILGHLEAFSSVEVSPNLDLNDATPVAICTATVNVSLGNNCEVSITPEQIDAGSFDPDGDPLTLSLNNSGPFNVGTYNVLLTVSDGSSTNQCFSTVVVQDVIGITAVCLAELYVSIASDGTAEVFPGELDGGSTDNCPLNFNITSGPTTFDCTDVGESYILLLTVDDGNGNSNTCFSEVFIQDVGDFCNDAPLAICASEINAAVGNDCLVTLTPEQIDAGSIDPNGDPLTLSLDNPGPYAPGVYNLILTASDGSLSNQCFSTVTVEDKQAPIAVCIAALNLSLATDGTAEVLPEYLDGGSTDNCAVNLSITSGPTSFDCTDVGASYTLVLTVEDDNGNSNNCFSQVFIQDPGNFCNVAPVAVCASALNVAVGNDCLANLPPESLDVGSFDPDGDPLTFSLDNPGPFAPGVYNLILTVSDGSLSNQCFSTVTVEDKQAPIAVCIAALNISIASDGTAEVLPEYLDGGSTDNCATNLSITSGPTNFDCTDVESSYTLVLTVEDDNGNSNTCFSQVSIQDPGNFCNVAPLAICLSALNVSVGNDCLANLQPEDLDVGSYDPDGDQLTFSLDNSGPFQPGVYDLILTVSDGSLSNQCFSTVTVMALDVDGDGFSTCAGDCDDTNDSVYPFAPEICDGLDNDCDDTIDEIENNSTEFEWIQRVELAEIDNNSGNNGGYVDFTDLIANLAKGQSYDLNLSPGFAGSSYTENWRVYIDFDQDGVFAHPAERVLQASDNGTINGSILIPNDALSGLTRIRITMGYDDAQQACSDNFEGETEDYSVFIDDCENIPTCIDYCDSEGLSTQYEWIRRVKLRTINNVSGDDNGYGDYTDLSTNVNAGNSYTIRLRPGFSGSSYQEYWRVWVDWNQDGTFDPVNELAVQGNDNGVLVESLTVPSNALSGATRMRVSMQYDEYASPCEAIGEGEVEDYTLIVNNNFALSTGVHSDQPIANFRDQNDIKQKRHYASTSSQIEVEAIHKIAPKLSLFPNPASHQLTVSFVSPEEESILLISNQLGQVVWSQELVTTKEQLVMNLDVSNLENGLYFVMIQSATTRIARRLVIVD